jgi:hypothetical protein
MPARAASIWPRTPIGPSVPPEARYLDGDEEEITMPKLVRLYITHCAIGFAIAAAFVAGLVAFDVAGLRHLVLDTQSGWLAGAMLVFSNGVVFAGVQFGIAVMLMADRPEGPRGGRRRPIGHVPVPVPVVAGARKRR